MHVNKLLFVVLSVYAGVSSGASYNSGGAGTYTDPFWIESIDDFGNGYWSKRGQTHTSLGGVILDNQLTEFWDFEEGLRKRPWGQQHYRLQTVKQMGTTVLSRVQVIKFQKN